MRTSLLVSLAWLGLIGCSTDTKDDATTDTASTTASSSTGTTGIGTTGTGTTGTGTTGTGTTGTSTTNTTLPDAVYGLSEHSLMHDDENRLYLLYVPKGYDPSTPAPLMMNFHGFGDTAEGHMRYSDMRDLSEAHNFLLVYPQGTRLEGDTHWNTYVPGPDNKSEADDFGFVEVMLDALSGEYAIDRSRVYATGFSNGGDFTYTLACYTSDLVTGIAPVSGLMWTRTQEDCVKTHPTPMVSMHGTNDFVRPYDGWDEYMVSINDTNLYWAEHNGIEGLPEMTAFSSSGLNLERYDFGTGDGGVSIIHYKVIGGFHEWFSFSDDGESTEAIIWNFLSQYDQDGLL